MFVLRMNGKKMPYSFNGEKKPFRKRSLKNRLPVMSLKCLISSFLPSFLYRFVENGILKLIMHMPRFYFS